MKICSETTPGWFSDRLSVPVLSPYAYQDGIPLVPAFKRINDMHGHAVGDRALLDFARIATAVLRPGDLLARWGGEEFVVLLPGTDQAGAAAIAERLRDAVARHALLIDCGSLRMTVSLGVAALAGHALGLDELASLADRALYRAKANGRNQVEIADKAGLTPIHPTGATMLEIGVGA